MDGPARVRQSPLARLLLVINLLLGQLLIGVEPLVPLLYDVPWLLLLHVEVVDSLRWLHLVGLVMAHHLVLILGLACDEMVFLVLRIKVCTGGAVEGASILGGDLMVLGLLNYLFHVLTRALQLVKLLRELLVEGLELNQFLGAFHALDTSQQVVRHIVGSLENVVLLHVDLVHCLVLNGLD